MTSVNVQNTMPSFNNYRSNMMVAPSSLSSTWQYSKQRASMNQEERNDSGMGSCSDFVSSPDSVTDNSRSSPQLNVATTYYTSPMMIPSRATFSQNLDSSQIMFTNSPPTSSIPEPVSEKKSECSYPSPDESNANSYSGADGALQHLQHSLEKNGFLPTVQSPKPSESSVEDDNKSAMDTTEENGEPKLNSPTLNANGKLRTHKCKQCGFVALTKVELWKHQRQHMKAHKLLTCPQCQFVTEYKHHFEFHTRNHAGSKPFKCNQCDYSCVNKSMLNSHLKSHSNVYQYRCLNCNYATKYCHSLKQHLRKYDHQPDVVLNPDGTPNPLPIIDVYGTRRGPKIKRQENQVVEENTPKREQVPLNYMNQAIPPPQVVPPHVIPPQMPFPFSLFPLLPGFPGGMVNPFLLQDLERLVQAHQATQMSPPVSANNTPVADDSRSTCDEQNDEVLDLSKSAEPAQKKRNRRKGRSFKLDRSRNDNSESEDDTTTTVFANVEVVEDKDAIRIAEEQNHLNNNDSEKHSSCQHCDIQFKEPILYNIHMEYHSNINPFTCKKCGEECNDSVSFFMHIARVPHY